MTVDTVPPGDLFLAEVQGVVHRFTRLPPGARNADGSIANALCHTKFDGQMCFLEPNTRVIEHTPFLVMHLQFLCQRKNGSLTPYISKDRIRGRLPDTLTCFGNSPEEQARLERIFTGSIFPEVQSFRPLHMAIA